MRQDNAVIRIRYKDFSAGTHGFTALHGVARWGARGVTVYLVPGLTVRERKAVLRRLRQEASRGFGPPLPLLAFVCALCADRVRTMVGTGVALIRLHPAVTLLPGAFVAAVMTLFVLASASKSVDFTQESGPVPQVGGLALSSADGTGQSGHPQAPVWDRELSIVDDNSGSASGSDGGQPLGLGKPAHGKCAHGKCARARRAKGWAKSANGSTGRGNGGPASGPRSMAFPPVKCTVAALAGCSASGQPANVPRVRRDRPPAGPAGLSTVKRGVGVGHHGR
jgi:hypothetical protein